MATPKINLLDPVNPALTASIVQSLNNYSIQTNQKSLNPKVRQYLNALRNQATSGVTEVSTAREELISAYRLAGFSPELARDHFSRVRVNSPPCKIPPGELIALQGYFDSLRIDPDYCPKVKFLPRDLNLIEPLPDKQFLKNKPPIAFIDKLPLRNPPIEISTGETNL